MVVKTVEQAGAANGALHSRMRLDELLSRIRWDPAWPAGTHQVGYLDHGRREIVLVDLSCLRFERGNRFAVFLTGRDGREFTLPLHRVREVRRDGHVIWQRQPHPAPSPGSHAVVKSPTGRPGDSRSGSR
jgi:uncharacterized protein (UPF0248 family)